MLKNKLLIFLLKRVLIFYIVLSIFVIGLLDYKLYLMVGLTAGMLFGLFRFATTHAMYEVLLGKADGTKIVGRVIFKFLINLSVGTVILVGSLLINKWLFFGIAAGLLLVPFAIFVNSLTEGFGLSRNNFE